jgi:hypothetical protein
MVDGLQYVNYTLFLVSSVIQFVLLFIIFYLIYKNTTKKYLELTKIKSIATIILLVITAGVKLFQLIKLVRMNLIEADMLRFLVIQYILSIFLFSLFFYFLISSVLRIYKLIKEKTVKRHLKEFIISVLYIFLFYPVFMQSMYFYIVFIVDYII